MQGLYTSQATLAHTTCSQHNDMILPSTFDTSLEAGIDQRPRQPESDNARLTGVALRMIHRLSSIFTLTGGGRWCDRRDANGWSMVAEPDRSQRGVWWRAFCVGRGQLPSFEVVSGSIEPGSWDCIFRPHRVPRASVPLNGCRVVQLPLGADKKSKENKGRTGYIGRLADVPL